MPVTFAPGYDASDPLGLKSVNNALQTLAQQRLLRQQLLQSQQQSSANSNALQNQQATQNNALANIMGGMTDPSTREMIDADPGLRSQINNTLGGLGNANVRNAQVMPGLTAAPDISAKVDLKRTSGLQKQAFASFRSIIANDSNSQDLLPKVDAIEKLVVNSGMATGEALQAAQLMGLPRDRAQLLALEMGDTEVRAARGIEESNRVATGVLRSLGHLPEGVENFSGAAQWLQSVRNIDLQFRRNLQLQENAHGNAVALETLRNSNTFQTKFVEEIINLIPTLAKPEMRTVNGQIQLGHSLAPDEIANYIDKLAGEYGIELPRAVKDALSTEAERASVGGQAQAAYPKLVTEQGLSPTAARAEIRRRLLGAYPQDTTFVDSIVRTLPAIPGATPNPSSNRSTDSLDPLRILRGGTLIPGR